MSLSDPIACCLMQLIDTTTRWTAGNPLRAHLTGAESTVRDATVGCRSFSDMPLPMRTVAIASGRCRWRISWSAELR